MSFKDAWNDAVKAGATTFTTGGLKPEILAAIAKLTKAAAGVVKSYSAMGVNSFIEFLGRVRTDIGAFTPDQVKIFQQEWDKANAKTASPMGDNPEATAIGVRAKQLELRSS